jgi:hypothetical protein
MGISQGSILSATLLSININSLAPKHFVDSPFVGKVQTNSF